MTEIERVVEPFREMQRRKDAELAAIRKAIEAQLSDKTTKKVRNIFFLCRSASDFRSIYCVQGNNDNIFAIAFVDEYNQVEIVI